MKKILFLIFYILYTLYFIPIVSAHSIGQPPYFKVNNKYSNLYPVPVSSVASFDLPQDLAPENYLLNQPINFEIDTSKFPIPPEVVKKSTFSWAFGDGASFQGLKTTHTYNKAGSYLVKINVNDGTNPGSQLLESALVNVLPDKNYQLPKAVIFVNNQTSKDPLTDILKFSQGEENSFDGTRSQNGTAKIVSYYWDFGDQSTSDQAQISHKYTIKFDQLFPLLRVKDQNGLINDTFVELQNSSTIQPQMVTKIATKPVNQSKNQIIYTTLGLTALLMAAIVVRLKFKKRN